MWSVRWQNYKVRVDMIERETEKPRVAFVVETDTDVRLVEGMSERFDLTLIGRAVGGRVRVSQQHDEAIRVVAGPSSRIAFAYLVIRRLLESRGKFDFVIVQGYGLAALAANVASRLTGIPTAMLVCSPYEAYYRCRLNHPADERVFRKSEFAAIQLVARLNAHVGRRYIVLSDYLARVVKSHGGSNQIDKAPVYGVDTDIFSPPDRERAELRVERALPSGMLIFFSSRVAPEKDAETLLEAFRMCRSRGIDAWLLHRSGGYEGFLRVAETYGIADRVVATDAVHPHGELPLDYQACDLCVQASREEGLGFSPLEALACRTPVVASAVGGLRETIVDGRTGWTYPVGDPATLAAAIEAVARDPEEAAQRAERGREMVARSFSKTVAFEKLEGIVRQAIAR
jgi:glycosyltransferase involved in cell wall biosynthesis